MAFPTTNTTNTNASNASNAEADNLEAIKSQTAARIAQAQTLDISTETPAEGVFRCLYTNRNLGSDLGEDIAYALSLSQEGRKDLVKVAEEFIELCFPSGHNISEEQKQVLYASLSDESQDKLHIAKRVVAISETEFKGGRAETQNKAKAGKAPKLEMQKLLDSLCMRLAQNETLKQAGEAKDLKMSAIAQLSPELYAGMTQVLNHFEFEFTEDSNGLRFIPEAIREDGSVKSAALYFLSLNAAPGSDESHAAILRCADGEKSYTDEDDIYPTGIRIVGKAAILNTPTLSCPVGLLLKPDLTEAQVQKVGLASNFGELAEWLKEFSGSSILSDLPEGFMMLFLGAEKLTSKKGNDYTLCHGTQLDENSKPMGDVSIFSPKDVDYWEGKASTTIIQYDDEKKLLNLLSIKDGSLLEALPLNAKTSKLKELEVGATYDWIGCELVQFKSSKGWVIKIRKQAGENGEPAGQIEQCYTNRKIEGVIDSGAKMILEAAGLPTNNLDAIFKVDVDEPFGTIHIRGQKPYSGGISVDVECIIHKTESEAKAEDALFAELGLL